MKIKYLFFIFFILFNCKKNNELTDSEKKNLDSLNEIQKVKDLKDNEAKQREIDESQSLIYHNCNNSNFRENLNIDVEEFYKLIFKSYSLVDDFLIIKNWNFLSKEYVQKPKVNANDDHTDRVRKQLTKEGTWSFYENNNQDSQISIFYDKETKTNKIIYSTLNKNNFRKLIIGFNENKFSTKEGNLVNDREPLISYNKPYVGEYKTIDRNIRFYKKNDFLIEVFTYVKSPVTKVIESEESLSGYDFFYDNTIKKTIYKFYFSTNN